jgi:molybdate transport system substrate-binding protein
MTRLLSALAAMLMLALPARADTALVAVAANYAAAATRIAADFAADTGHQVQITTGSTGKLYAQIAEGAPFAVLLSADTKTPARLLAEGLAVPDTGFTYAIGGLTLYSTDAGLIGADPKAALTADGLRFLAIANPDLAPYGTAAQQALTALGLWENLQAKIVMGQNIGQVFSMVQAGAADAAFVATSALKDVTTGSRWDVPQSLFQPLRQDAVLLLPGRDNPAAIAFLDYLKGDKARAIAATFGYTTGDDPA